MKTLHLICNAHVGAALWGVGNHGGNPSRKDLEDIDGMIKTSSVEIKHSSPEDYFAEQKFEKIYDRSMQPCFVGCYSSLSAVKRKNTELETAALGFVSKRDALNYYPRGEKKADKSCALSMKNINLSSCRVIGGIYELRLFNGTDGENLCEISCGEIKKSFSFGKYEVKTVVFDGCDFTEKQI